MAMKQFTTHCRPSCGLTILLALALLIPALSGCGKSPRVENAPRDGTPARIEGCYSSLHFNAEGGDLLGIEINIRNSRDGYFVLFQESEGAPTVLHLAPATLDGDRISFTVPSGRPGYGLFEGTFTAGGLAGKFSGRNDQIVLNRKESYWTDNAPAKQITGCYTDLQAHGAGGDLLGTELLIVLSKDAYYVLYRHSSGKPSPPLLLPATIKGSSISFTLPPGDPFQGEFRGTITGDGLFGKFSRNGAQIILKREKGYRQ